MSDLPEGWVSLGEYLATHTVYAQMWEEIERQTMVIETRRTVQVSTRKYRARRRRKR